MNIILKVEPNTPPVNWNDFIKNTPANSIALDGYVFGATHFLKNEKGCWSNFNHHEEVDRLSTRATCAQVLLAIRQGFMKGFDTHDTINIYINDCDQDVCLSVFLLKNYHLAEGVINPLLNKLVHIEDMMDTCAGAYPFPIDLPALREVSWVFQPYTNFRMQGGIERKNINEFISVIKDVENRIMKYCVGQSEKIDSNASYEVIGGGKDWKMVIEHGYEARTQMMKDGINAFVSVREREDGSYTYSIGKMSKYISFYILDIITNLNIIESQNLGLNVNELKDSWGGSDLIAGSPRVNGSKLKPSKIEELINIIQN